MIGEFTATSASPRTKIRSAQRRDKGNARPGRLGGGGGDLAQTETQSWEDRNKSRDIELDNDQDSILGDSLDGDGIQNDELSGRPSGLGLLADR